MLYYILLWTLLGFITHFHIIFGTNLLIGGPAQNCCFLPISEFRRKRISNGMKPSGTWFLERTWSRGLGPYVKTSTRKARGRGRALHPRGPRVAPPTYLFLLYIPTYPQTTRYGAKNQIPPPQPSVPEIPSWGLFRSSAGGGIDHGGLLHQHHSLSDDVWVVYLRPSGP